MVRRRHGRSCTLATAVDVAEAAAVTMAVDAVSTVAAAVAVVLAVAIVMDAHAAVPALYHANAAAAEAAGR